MALNLWQCVTAVICVWGMFEIVMPSPAMTSYSRQKRKDANSVADDSDKKKIKGCEEGWTFLRETQSCYKYIDDRKDFFTARLFCKSLEGNLAMPKTEEQNAFVDEIRNAHDSSEHDIWIGMNDLRRPGTFRWDDDEQLNYSRWAKDAPSKWNEDNCGSMSKGAYWNDKQCGYPKNFVCQVPKDKSSANKKELKPCPKGWAFNGTCLKLVARDLNFNDSRKACEFEDATITLPTHPNEYRFIVRTFGVQIWIGLNDIVEEGYWVKENGRPVTYERWDNNRAPPRNKDKNCAASNTDAKWVAVGCHIKRRLVCQKPAQDDDESGNAGQDPPVGA